MANRLIRYLVGHGAGVALSTDSGQLVIGDSSPATSSTNMYGVAADFSGNLFIADSANSCIYKVKESGDATGVGTIQVFAGTKGAEGSNDGKASVARFKNPHGIAVDKAGNVYVADTGNKVVRVIDSNGNVGTVTDALDSPWGVACAPNGDVFVTDKGGGAGGHCVYRIRRERGNLFGNAIVVAGKSGTSGDVSAEYCDDARLHSPTGIAVDPSGYVFVCDSYNNKIKRIGLDGFVVRYCGTATAGDHIGTYQTSRFTDLGYLACDKSGDLYVIDHVYNSEIESEESDLSQEYVDLNAVGDKIKKIDKNGNTSLISVVTGGGVIGITASPAGVIYVTKSSGGGTNSTSSVSSVSSVTRS